MTSKKPELLEMRYKEAEEHLAEEMGPVGCGGEAGSHQLEKREQIISSKEQEEQRKGGLKILACLKKGENLFVPEEWWEAKLKQRSTCSCWRVWVPFCWKWGFSGAFKKGRGMTQLELFYLLSY